MRWTWWRSPPTCPSPRIDNPDVVYKTEAAKFRAVLRQIKECHEKGQPVLVGTISIEKSELLSNMLKKRGHPPYGYSTPSTMKRKQKLWLRLVNSVQ